MKVIDLGDYFSLAANIVNRVATTINVDGNLDLNNLHGALSRMSNRDLIGIIIVLASCVAAEASSLKMFREIVVVKDPL